MPLSIEEKLRMVEFCTPVFRHIRVIRDILKDQRDAKKSAKGEWNDGYAAAMDDAIKSLDHMLEDYS